MKIKLIGCIFVLDEIISQNIKKNNEKYINVLVDKKDILIKVDVDKEDDIKNTIRNKIIDILGNDKFHLEQVYTLGDKKYLFNDEIDIIYIAITNHENIKKDLKEYKLKKFDVKDNKIIFGEQIYNYYTEQKITNGGIEYFHVIDTDDLKLEKQLLEILISYKHLKSRINNTDILFKFLPNSFTLEDVRQLYELITKNNVDKSNFRKRILNYVEDLNKIVTKGYRPTKLYKYKANKNDIWI